MELVLLGFFIGAIITYIIFVWKPFKKDKIKYFVRRENYSFELIKANITKRKTEYLCSDLNFFLYGLTPSDYEKIPNWSVKEVTIED